MKKRTIYKIIAFKGKKGTVAGLSDTLKGARELAKSWPKYRKVIVKSTTTKKYAEFKYKGKFKKVV